MKTAIIYTRVSTVDQATDGYSLMVQARDCRKYAENNGYKVLKLFKEAGESAKLMDRTQLLMMLDYCTKHKPDALIVHKVDRLARNTENHYYIKGAINKVGTVLRSATEPISDDPAGEFIENILAGTAQFDNALRSWRTKMSMEALTQKGRWLFNVPYGYKLVSTGDNKSKVFIDPERGATVTQIFELFATGAYTQTEVLNKVNPLLSTSSKLSTHRVNRMLRNPFYMGIVRVKNMAPDGVRGEHSPLISPELFVSVQRVLAGKRGEKISRSRVNPDFPLRGVLQCGYCGRKLTGSWSKGKSKKYAYYHCTRTGCAFKSLPKTKAEKEFIQLLDAISPQKEYVESFKTVITKTWKIRTHSIMQESIQLNKRIKQIHRDKEAVALKNAQGATDNDTCKQLLSSLDNQIVATTVKLKELVIEDYDAQALINYSAYMLEHLTKIWERSSIAQKATLQKIVFPNGLIRDNQSYRTPELSPLYAIIRDSNGSKSHLVARRRVELLFQA